MYGEGRRKLKEEWGMKIIEWGIRAEWRIPSSILEQNRSFFAKKVSIANEWFAQKVSNLLKKWLIHSFAHLWWATWWILSRSLIPSEQHERNAHGRSFVLSDLSHSLTSLRRNKQNFKKTVQNVQNLFEWTAHFLWAKEKMRDLLKTTERFAHLYWAIWGNRSHLLICHEWPERFAHSRSFVLSKSDLSEWLTFAHLFWAIWANEQILNPG